MTLQGYELIKSNLPDVPQLPGVYRMFDRERQVIYIGKAKNLKNRLTNYVQMSLDTKTLNMVSATCFLEYSVTSSEVEALMLEAQLIKKFKPKYNILLRDGKSFPFIKLRLDHEYPQLLKFRGKNLTNGKFFGPFASPEHVDTTLRELQKIFKLRSCTDNYFASRKRPCLQYQIGRCYAPCVGKIGKEDYDELVGQVKDFLQGKSSELQQVLSKKMEVLSQQLCFEKAAEIRDRIKALSYVQLKAGLFGAVKDADIIVILEKNGHYCIEVFLYRVGQACGNIAYFPQHTESSTKSEVLEYFLTQFYQSQQVPGEIILNHNIENINIVKEAIKLTNNLNKLDIHLPSIGDKMKLIRNAELNAEIALDNHLKKFAKNHTNLEEVQQLFHLAQLPQRIEVYDNSHIMGKFAVGAMIVAGQMGFEKKEYRIFNLDISEGDDYEMLKMVLTRRFTRLKQEPDKMPSLMIIDGGKGHLSVVMSVMEKFAMKLPFVCMSKGPDRNAGYEQFHMKDGELFTLDKNLPVMKYLQILRDEAHSFAIKNHRLGRSRAIKASSLDEIVGIGESRKKALLHYFGSYKAICDASFDELLKVKGISKPLAQVIFSALNK